MLTLDRKIGQSLVMLDMDGNVICEIEVLNPRRSGRVSIGIKNDRAKVKVLRAEQLKDSDSKANERD